jgi:two-component system, NarL family, sensor kinase
MGMPAALLDSPVVATHPASAQSKRFKRGTTRWVIVAAVVRSIVVFVLLAVLSLWALRSAALTEAKKDAGATAELTARVALAPFLTDGIVQHDPAALEALSAAAATFIETREVARMKIWSTDNEVLWADDARLIGRVFELEPDEIELFETQGSAIEVSDLQKDENVFELEAGQTKLLEVYLGTHTPSGEPLLVETYYPYSNVTDLVDGFEHRFFPLLLAGLGLLSLVQVPLAVSLARQLAKSQRERERLLQRAIDVSDIERRRIAAEVHDGAVQELIGIGFSLAANAERAPEPVAAELRELAVSTRATVRTLRTLLNSIYPVSVPAEGWVAGLGDLLGELRINGVDVRVDAPDERPPRLEELLILRVAREALRNAKAHSDATMVTVYLEESPGGYVLEVRDNGRGFDSEQAQQSRSAGHLGLELLKDLATDAGATVEVFSQPGTGTTVRLDLAVQR